MKKYTINFSSQNLSVERNFSKQNVEKMRDLSLIFLHCLEKKVSSVLGYFFSILSSNFGLFSPPSNRSPKITIPSFRKLDPGIGIDN